MLSTLFWLMTISSCWTQTTLAKQFFFIFPPTPLSAQEQIHVPVYHPTPSQTRLATQLTEEEQVRIAQRIGLIHHLPKGVYDPGRDGSEKKIREWGTVVGDHVNFQGKAKTFWVMLCYKGKSRLTLDWRLVGPYKCSGPDPHRRCVLIAPLTVCQVAADSLIFLYWN